MLSRYVRQVPSFNAWPVLATAVLYICVPDSVWKRGLVMASAGTEYGSTSRRFSCTASPKIRSSPAPPSMASLPAPPIRMSSRPLPYSVSSPPTARSGTKLYTQRGSSTWSLMTSPRPP